MASRPGTVFGALRNLFAALLYGLAVVCSVFGCSWGARRHRTSTGPTPQPAISPASRWSFRSAFGWALPLAVSATLLAMLLRWPARSQPDERRLGPTGS